jgi:hypothetical protein
MVPGSILDLRIDCSSPFNDSIPRPSSPEAASGWLQCKESYADTEVKCGRRQPWKREPLTHRMHGNQPPSVANESEKANVR